MDIAAGVKMVLARTLAEEHVYTTPTRERYTVETRASGICLKA
jgi:hypothetical protein